jgi:hypothetical protein
MASIYDKASLVLIPSGTKTSKVYSQKPTNGDGDFTFSRSTAATRVNASGNIEKETQNLLLQSNNFTTTWGATAGTMTGGQADKDGGTSAWKFEATGSGQSRFNQTISVSGVNTISMYAKAGTANFLCLYIIGSGDPRAFFNLSTGAVGSTGANIDANIEDVGNGWYRCSLTFDRTSSTLWCFVSNADGDFNSAIGDSIYIQDAQLEQGLVARDYIETTTTAIYGGITDNVPRLDYTDSSCPALLLEPQRTNLLYHSEYFGDWSLFGGASLTFNDATSPEGIANAVKMTSGGIFAQYPTAANTDYVFSVFAKTDTATSIAINYVDQNNPYRGGTISYNFSTDVASVTLQSENNSVSADREDYGNGWIRVMLKFKTDINKNYNYQQIAFSGGNGWIYGAQYEAGSYATSYIPTYGSAVTRNSDDFSDNGYQSKGIFGADSGSIFLDFGTEFTIFDGVSNSSPTDLFQFVDITSYGGGYMRFRGGESNHYLQLVSMGAADNSLSFTDQTKYCICWDSNGVDFYGNGALIQSTTITIVPSFDRLERGITGNGREGRVKEVLFFPTKLSSQEAIDLTTI